jgi:hypothetical protein
VHYKSGTRSEKETILNEFTPTRQTVGHDNAIRYVRVA